MNDFISTYPFLAILTFTAALMVALEVLLAIIWLGYLAYMKVRRRETQAQTGRGWSIAAYALAMLPPVLWLLSRPILKPTLTPMCASLAEGSTVVKTYWDALATTLCTWNWIVWPLALLFLVFVFYLRAGAKDDRVYRVIFQPHKFAWTLSGLVILFIAWFIPSDRMIIFTRAYPTLILLAATLTLMVALFNLLELFRQWRESVSPDNQQQDNDARQSDTKSSGYGRYAYIFTMLPPVLWLLAPAFLSQLQRPNSSGMAALYTALRFGAENWFMLPLALLFVVFVIYLQAGVKDDQAYKDIFQPRKFVWFVFGLVVLFVAWFVPSNLLKARVQFSGMHADLVFDINEAIEDMVYDGNCLGTLRQINEVQNQDLMRGCRSSLLQQANALEASLDLLQASVWADPELLELHSQAANALATAVEEARAMELSQSTEPAVSSKLDEISVAAKELRNSTRRLAFSAAVAGVDYQIQQQAKESMKQIDEEVFPQIEEVKKMANALAAAGDNTLENAVTDTQKALDDLQGIVGTVTDPGDKSILFRVSALTDGNFDTGLNSGFGDQNRDTILKAVAQMQILVDDIQTQVAQLDFPEDTPERARYWRLNEIQDKARALDFAAEALRFDPGPSMLMVALLFIIFLLMPWLLYISFIISKRDQIINDRLDLLSDLSLLDRFRTASSLIRDPTIEGANRARDFDSVKTDSVAAVKPVNVTVLRESSLAYEKAFKLVERLKRTNETETKNERQEIDRLADTEILNRQTFHSREYLIPLLILTGLTLVGWYFTIFANGANGLVRFIEQGGGSFQLIDLLAQFTSFTMIFAGAWLFMIIMLTYRWVTNDLFPRSYFYASMRLVYGLLVGMVFLTLFGDEVVGAGRFLLLLLAFFVGIAPLEFVNAMWKGLKNFATWVDDIVIHKYTSQIIKYFERPDWASRQPLTELEDVTVWDDARFYQEGIQNIHALATADLARLAVRTPFDGQTLVDWVDQAVLRIHTKVLWHAGMSAIGARGATDLFDACGVDDQGKADSEMVSTVVQAFNTAQLMSISGDPRFDSYNEAAELQANSESLGEAAKAVKDANTKLDPAKAESLDNVSALRQQIKALSSKVTEAGSARESALAALTAIVGAEAASTAVGSELEKQLKALTEGESSLIAQAEKAAAQEAFTREALEGELAKKANEEKPTQAALKSAQDAVKALVDPAGKAKKAVEESQLLISIKAVKGAVDALQKNSDDVIAKAASVKKQADGLSKTNYTETTARLEELLTAAKKAEVAAGELVTATESGGEAFKATKEKVAVLKEALGAGAEKLQAKIATAKESVAKLKDDGDIAATKAALAPIASFVGTAESTGDESIAAKMKVLAEPFEDVDTKVTEVTTKVTDLATAITTADTLAQSIKKDDATSWDNVKALASALSKLTKAIADTEAARKDVDDKINKVAIQQTLGLRESQKKVKELSTADAKKKAEEAEKAFKEGEDYLLSASSEQAKLTDAKTKVEEAVKAAETLVSAVGPAAEGAMTAVLPIRLTKEILGVMLHAMQNDPNIHYIRHFWKVQAKKVEKDVREEVIASPQETAASNQAQMASPRMDTAYDPAKFDAKLDYIEGIGPKYAKKLKACGITSPRDLLTRGATPHGRKDLAEQAGIRASLILEWVNHADLYRIKGIGAEYADLLEASGVDTVAELAARKADNLMEKLRSVKAEKNLVGRLPSDREVRAWVRDAKALPRIISH